MDTGPHTFNRLKSRLRKADEEYTNSRNNYRSKRHLFTQKSTLLSIRRDLRECRELLENTIWYYTGFFDAVQCKAEKQEEYDKKFEKLKKHYETVDKYYKEIEKKIKHYDKDTAGSDGYSLTALKKKATN